ncbi:MAG TPA: EamA family transporter [Nitrospirota bacterium]|nr:EamA family transporter [Nitrospirota bacterium]
MTKTPTWFVPAVTALLLWGAWGLFQKLATNQMPPRNVYLVGAGGALAVVLVMLATSEFPLQVNTRGILFAVLAGGCSSLGGLLFLHAVSKGKASVVIPFTALYPLITIILSFTILKETITAQQGMGIVLALISMALLAG